jgi:hypothetical protein
VSLPIMIVTGRTARSRVVFCFALASAFASAASATETTIHLTLGIGATTEERWDGWILVRGGELVSLRSWHFLDHDPLAAPGPGTRGPGDRVAEIIEPNAWRVAATRDGIDGFHRINYLEMSPTVPLETLYFPVGLYATVRDDGAATVDVRSAQGDFSFRLAELADRATFLEGRAAVARVPTPEPLSTGDFEDDDPAIAALPDGSLAVAWVAYAGEADRVLLRERRDARWSAPIEATPRPGDLFRCSLAVDGEGALWVFWSERSGEAWTLYGRRRERGGFGDPVRISGGGSNLFHRAAARDGHLFVAWQSLVAAPTGEASSDVWLRELHGGKWRDPVRVSESPKNDWEPAIAAGPGGSAYLVWDTYDRGNYDVMFRAYRAGRLDALRRVTSSARFEAQADVAVDPQGRPWIAWNESGVNWGKDQGFLITPPMATPIHQERSVRVAVWDGSRFEELAAELPKFYLYRLFSNVEKPRIGFDGRGALTLVFRHWTRQMSRGIGSFQIWESWLTRFTDGAWSWPVPLPSSSGSIEKVAAMTVDGAGDLWLAWMTDGRTLSDAKPRNAEVFAGNIGRAPSASVDPAKALVPWVEAPAEAVPIHLREAEDVARVRSYRVNAGGKSYAIYRGDLHRHTDVSQDFKYDGSLIEVYRYAIDAAAFDFIAPTDHQAGWDQEFSWWQSQKLADLFHLPGAFVPIFGYERSLPYPNGHRNVFFLQRGVRTLPVPKEEQAGQVGAAKLYEYLRASGGISMPHSSATDQGTDWRDNDPELEPLIEIFQGYRGSYEYKGAPRAASDEKLLAQRSGYQPLGFWWNALERGYKLGVQASSDHWSTHISYACLIAPSGSRQDLFEAMKKRHSYGATDNIVLDFQATAGGATYIMGDVLRSASAPKLTIRAIGTGEVSQVVVVKNQQIVYTAQPGMHDVSLEFLDTHFVAGEPAYYYVRVLQSDGQLAWSSPIWVEPPG